MTTRGLAAIAELIRSHASAYSNQSLETTAQARRIEDAAAEALAEVRRREAAVARLVEKAHVVVRDVLCGHSEDEIARFLEKHHPNGSTMSGALDLRAALRALGDAGAGEEGR